MNANLSLGQGRGLRMLMSDQPCRANPAGCHGAKMAADHVQSVDHRLYGDYELTMRAPFTLSGDDPEGLFPAVLVDPLGVPVDLHERPGPALHRRTQ